MIIQFHSLNLRRRYSSINVYIHTFVEEKHICALSNGSIFQIKAHLKELLLVLHDYAPAGRMRLKYWLTADHMAASEQEVTSSMMHLFPLCTIHSLIL